METYFYVDIFFLLNFIMNFFLILITAIIRQKKYRIVKWFLLSVLYAAFTTIITYYCWNVRQIQYIWLLPEMLSLMYLAYKPDSLRILVRDFVTFFVLSALVGGIILMLKERLTYSMNGETARFSVVWIMLAVVILFILFWVMRWEMIRHEHQKKTVLMATVYHNSISHSVKVLYDTGNQLISPYTGESVTIISDAFAKTLHISEGQLPVLIPYHSIGGNGMLQAFRIEKMVIEDGQCKEGFLAAVSDCLCTDKEIQMILNIT